MKEISIIIVLMLAIIFFANAITALKSRENKREYFPDWLIFIGGFAMFFLIIAFPILLITLKDTQEELNHPIKYEIVKEPLYRIK